MAITVKRNKKKTKGQKTPKALARAFNHRRQKFWLDHGVVMLPTLYDEIRMHRAIIAKKQKEVMANG